MNKRVLVILLKILELLYKLNQDNMTFEEKCDMHDMMVELRGEEDS